MSALFERLTGLALRDPGWLLLALAVPLVLLLRRRGPALRFAPAPLLSAEGPMPRSVRQRLLPLPVLLSAAGLLLVVLALARPVERSVEPVVTEGIDVVLALDTSSSMGTPDMARGRTRLEVAREAAARFVRGRPDDRIGLVAFARFADVRCPPTRDHEALLRVLADLGPVAGDGPEDATGIGTAAAKAVQVLSESGARSRVAVLLTDGEENVALAGAPGEIAPAHAGQLAARLGVKVYAVVAGSGRPLPGGGRARPDTRDVERMAARTGGTLLEAPDAAAMEAVYGRIDALERTAFAEPHVRWTDRFLPFLLAGIALLGVGRVVGRTAWEVAP